MNTSPQRVPFDLVAAKSMGDSWSQEFAWPIAQSEATPVLDAQLKRLMTFIAQLSDVMERNRVLLCAARVLLRVRALTETALAIQAESSRGLTLVGGPPEVAWLRGGLKGSPPGSATNEQFAKVLDARVHHALLRRLIRTATWTSLPNLFQTLFAPEITAISHSDLVRKEIRCSGYRVKFFHAYSVLDSARRNYGNCNFDIHLDDLVIRLTNVLAEVNELEPAIRTRLHGLIRVEVNWRLRDAANDLDALSKHPKLPKAVWSASGGPHASRAIGLEVLRRGGEVVRHDHSGTTGLSLPHEIIALLEFAPSNQFIVATEQVARIVKRENIGNLVHPYQKVRLGYSKGFTSYAKAVRLKPLPARAQPTVIYAPTMLSGFQSHTPALPHDLVYLDFQIRMACLLTKMPINVICKPHPEGLLRGQIHPVTPYVPTSTLPFEKHMDEADIFVFDYTRSTSTWKALCTDRRVVLIDLGLYIYTDYVKPYIKQRCRIVAAEFDDRGRVQVIPEELEEAILGKGPKPDPTWFRQQFLEPEYAS